MFFHIDLLPHIFFALSYMKNNLLDEKMDNNSQIRHF